MSHLSRLRLLGFALVLAITLALLSVFFERVGPELVQYGDSDYKPVLKGGFPIAYLFDAPGISIERQLSFGEDRLLVGALIVDIAFYLAVVLLLARFILHRRSVRKQAGSIGM